jgi:hypothetical protein
MRLSRFFKVCALALTLAVVTPSIAPVNNIAIAEAATAIKLNKTKLSLTVGDSAKLTISGTKSKITWTTSKKTVVTVDKTGKVTAVRAGSATITATVNKKKYSCKVTVKAKNPNIAKAPFTAQEVVVGDFKAVIPKDWVNTEVTNTTGAYLSAIHPKSKDLETLVSGIQIAIEYTGDPKIDYSIVKEQFTARVTEAAINSQLAAQGLDVTVTDFKTSDFESTIGTAFKTEFKMNIAGMDMSQVVYDIFIDNYFIELTVASDTEGTTPEAFEVGEYLLNTLELAK